MFLYTLYTISSKSPAPLDYTERNALRYTVGFLVRSLREKVNKGAHPLKEIILLCIADIIEDGGKYYLFAALSFYSLLFLKETKTFSWILNRMNGQT